MGIEITAEEHARNTDRLQGETLELGSRALGRFNSHLERRSGGRIQGNEMASERREFSRRIGVVIALRHSFHNRDTSELGA
ncbi:hypothetical protein [Bryocella elongata]|nr:hypothetical protein [Bryocella elongata]